MSLPLHLIRAREKLILARIDHDDVRQVLEKHCLLDRGVPRAGMTQDEAKMVWLYLQHDKLLKETEKTLQEMEELWMKKCLKENGPSNPPGSTIPSDT